MGGRAGLGADDHEALAAAVDLYYKEQYVGPAVTKLTGFFTKNLAAGRTPAEAASV